MQHTYLCKWCDYHVFCMSAIQGRTKGDKNKKRQHHNSSSVLTKEAKKLVWKPKCTFSSRYYINNEAVNEAR